MKEQKQSGFAHLGIVIIILTLVLVGSLGFVFYNKFIANKDSDRAGDSSSSENKVDFKTFEEAYSYLKDKAGYKQPMLTGFKGIFNENTGEKQWYFEILDKSSENTPDGEKFAQYNMKNYKIRSDGYFNKDESRRIIASEDSKDYGITLNYEFDDILKSAKNEIEERGLKPGYIYMVQLTDYGLAHSLDDYWDVTYANKGEESKVSGDGTFKLKAGSTRLRVKDLSFEKFSESNFTLTIYKRNSN